DECAVLTSIQFRIVMFVIYLAPNQISEGTANQDIRREVLPRCHSRDRHARCDSIGSYLHKENRILVGQHRGDRPAINRMLLREAAAPSSDVPKVIPLKWPLPPKGKFERFSYKSRVYRGLSCEQPCLTLVLVVRE